MIKHTVSTLKKELLKTPNISQGIVKNSYFTFKKSPSMIFPQKRLSITHTVSTLKK